MVKFEQRPAEHGPGVRTVTPASTESTNKGDMRVVLWRRRCGLSMGVLAGQYEFPFKFSYTDFTDFDICLTVRL